jgi:hypothetical protein
MVSAVGDTLDGCNALGLLIDNQPDGQQQEPAQKSPKQPMVQSSS